jgi:hypothetical protein
VTVGTGELDVAGTTVLQFTTSTVRVPVTLAAAITIPANATVPAADTLTLLTGTVIDEPITNSGLIRLGATTTFNGLPTTNPGSVLRVGGMGGTPT